MVAKGRLLFAPFLCHLPEKAMAPHSSTLAWKIPWMEEPGRLQSMGSLRVGHDWATSLSISLSRIGEGNGNPHKVGHDWSDLAAVAAAVSFNLYAEYIMRNAGLEEAQAGIKIAGRNINNLRYADDTTLMAESEEELKASWWKWKRRVKKLA